MYFKKEFAAVDLGNGSWFDSGKVPLGKSWDDPAFEHAWHLHPEEKHWIKIHGRWVQTPRWQQAYGADYHYTGQVNRALPIPDLLKPLHTWVRDAIDARLQGLLLNWYEGPDHYIGQHHDSNKHMVKDSPIVTVSFGETRTFRLTLEKKGAVEANKDFSAEDGTVFVMPFQTNRFWKHGVPKSTRYKGAADLGHISRL